MTDRPIIFSAPMARALLDGRKTQTRRVLKRRDTLGDDAMWALGDRDFRSIANDPGTSIAYVAGYAPGDRLWVRETIERANGEAVGYPADGTWLPNTPWRWKRAVLPSIHMPRAFSRLTLIVEGVKVERLQDISEEDAIAEGATCRPNCSGFQDRYDGWSMDWSKVGQPSKWAENGRSLAEGDISLGSAVTAFAGFINELHDPRWNLKGDGIFGANPWVAAISFRVVKANIDAIGIPSPSASIRVTR